MKVTSGSNEATGNKMKRFGRTLNALLAGVLLVVSVGIRADISAHLDRQQAALGDTLRLTLVADSSDRQLNSQLDELRTAIRAGRASAELGSMIESLSDSILHLDEERKKNRQLSPSSARATPRVR